ncbi:putative FAD-binding domain, FAD/NAD(P)-binding domain superfamily [Septoria linicola]|nr:putative FAD-binding domain, FAD/NAD(P)-binding domain superfamily [Septoria linicola]
MSWSTSRRLLTSMGGYEHVYERTQESLWTSSSKIARFEIDPSTSSYHQDSKSYLHIMGALQQSLPVQEAIHGDHNNESSPSTQDEVNCAAPTGINILIIGAGVGGLAAALECHRKGHTVRVLERPTTASAEGDMSTIGASGLRLLDNYPSMKREYEEIAVHNLWLRYRKWTGEDLGEPFPFGAGAKGAEVNKHADRPPMSTALRPLFHAMLYHQLDRFGIKVQLNTNVREFYKDIEKRIGGVVTDTGEHFEADLVIAADGLHSKSRSLIPNSAAEAKPTGRTIFRCSFPLEIAVADPLVAETFGLLNGQNPLMQVWLGPETHAVVLAYVDKHGMNGRLCFGVSFREDESTTRKESWNETISSEEVLAVMNRLSGWSEAMKQLIRITPPTHIVAWPLNPRSPSSQWHSPGGHVLQLGDAAHPFLPTYGNGATQAIEDAITIAVCLAQSYHNQTSIPTAVKVNNLLRADRVSCAQLLGFVNAARVQKTDLEKVGNDPSTVQHKTPKWLWALDAEKYADEFYDEAAASLEVGVPRFQNTNIPNDYTPKPWTIDEVEALQKAGKPIELKGDWS